MKAENRPCQPRPAVRELREYGFPRFENRLRQWGMTTLDRSPDDYGLTLILGGAEGRLVEIAALYAKLAELASNAAGGCREVRLLRNERETPSKMKDLGAAVAYLTLQALTAVNRPDEEGFWRDFSSSKWVAWKTGTSFGLRDAWAVGVTPNYTMVPEESRFDRMCAFHQMAHLDGAGRFRVDSRCESVDRMRHESWFVLPPVQEYYYRADLPEYRQLPPFRADCGGGPAAERGSRVMNLIYPEPDMSVFIPVDLDGRAGEVIFEAVHREDGATIHWHLDENYLASTRVFHQISVNPEPGEHRLVLTDGEGRRLERTFRVVSPARRDN